jgi:PAS domain S-box-containing protein
MLKSEDNKKSIEKAKTIHSQRNKSRLKNSEAAVPTGKNEYKETTRLFIKMLVTIFLCEAAIMVLLNIIPLSRGWEIIVDPLLLTALGTLILYWLFVRPIWLSLKQRNLAVEELKESEEKLRFLSDITEQVDDSVITTDLNFKITWVNNAFQRLYGYAPEEVLGRSPDFPNVEPNSEEIQNDIYETVSSGEVWRGEVLNRKKDGSIFPCELMIFALLDEHGNIKSYAGHQRDITERKKVERDLLLARQSIEAAGAGIYWIDKDARFVNANLAGCRQLGYSKEKLLSMTVHDIDPNFPKERWPSHWEELRQTGSISFETHHRHKSGNIFPVEVRLNYIKFEDKEYNFAFAKDITERKKAKDKLERYKIILENSSDLAYLCDTKGNVTFLNRIFEELSGHKPEEFLGKSFEPLFDKENLEKAIDLYSRTLNGESPIREVCFKDTGKLCEYHNFPLKDEKGRIVGVVGVARDITQRKKAEIMLQKERVTLNNIIELNPYAISIYDAEGHYVNGNKAFLETFKTAPPEGYSIFEDPIATQSGFSQEMQTKVKQGKTAKIPEMWYNPSSLSPDLPDIKICFESTIFPTFTSSGEIQNFVLMFNDITERKKAEDKLQESEERYRKVVEDQTEFIVRWQPDGIRTFVNDSYCRYFGISHDEAFGTSFFPFITEDYRKAVEKRIGSLTARNPVSTGEHQVIRPDGTIGWNQWTDRAIFNEEGMLIEFQSVGRDITERKKAEEKLLDYQAKLKSLASQLSLTEESERRRIATELHDQIGQSLVFSKIKLDELHQSATSSELTEALDEICNNIDQIIQDTRTLTFDLSSPILNQLGLEAAVAEWLDVQIQEKHGIETDFEDDGQQKSLDDDIQSLLFRNVRELLVNIIKHAHANKVKISIRRVDEHIHIDVEDDGKGFDYVKVTSGAAKETKFGLFSIRQRLEQLGGHFEVDSEPGRGSKFTMTAPLKLE